MSSAKKYIVTQWNRLFATTPEEKYPALDEDQKKYRKEFGGIVDKYLIHCESNRDKEHPKADHYIVYIDADNDIDWQIDDGENKPSTEYKQQRKAAISKLNIEQAMPVQNLSEEEIITFKKLLGEGYNAALSGNFEDVDMAMDLNGVNGISTVNPVTPVSTTEQVKKVAEDVKEATVLLA